MTDHDLERKVRHSLREALDRELGPNPTWADSSAARRVAAIERRARRRWPLRALAVAALIAVTGGAAALLGGGLSDVPPPEALPSPLEASEPPPEAFASPLELSGVTNGWIAFTVSQPGPGDGEDDLDVWLAALDQEARRVIGTDIDDVDQLCPAFSPDGRSLAYGRVEGHGTEYENAALVVADVSEDGTVADRLTIEVGDGLPPPCPVWSPDASQVAFGEARTSPINPRTSAVGSEVWIVTLADQDITVLPDLLATDLEWSPDGEYLAIASGGDEPPVSGFTVTDGMVDSRIHLYAPSSGALRSLDDTLGADSLTWSPHGGLIAYTGIDRTPAAVAGDTLGILVIDVETEEQWAVAPPYGAIHGIGPVWSPDGETIVYQRCSRPTSASCSGESHVVVLVTPDDRSAQTGFASQVAMPIARTTAGPSGQLRPWRVTWSPDGRYLLYVAWTYPTATSEKTLVVAVPTDQDAPAVLVADIDGIAPYGIFDDNMRVPIQIWGRQPPD
jgi:hypothetical protein